ncbi:hypothetical protein NS383_17730 [Pseudomonas oryzihabitans]|nr:hypothetical protein NS383_17730 [Pseudomonas psychrotolerans]
MYEDVGLACEVLDRRLSEGMSQADFWARFGVSQSSGSRIEKTGRMLMPICVLLRLYCAGLIALEDLPRVD